jgi:hypothetical protein
MYTLIDLSPPPPGQTTHALELSQSKPEPGGEPKNTGDTMSTRTTSKSFFARKDRLDYPNLSPWSVWNDETGEYFISGLNKADAHEYAQKMNAGWNFCPGHNLWFEGDANCPGCKYDEEEYLDSLPDEDPFCLPTLNSGIDETQYT